MEKKKVFITGLTGFVGSHLADYLLSLNRYEISGTYISPKSLSLISHIQEKVKPIQVDLMDEGVVQKVIREEKPDIVFHLAALAATGESIGNPKVVLTTNVILELNVFEAIRKANLLNCVVVVPSSALIYGAVKKEYLPIKENTPLFPTNSYAVSKIGQDYLALQYFLSYGMHIVRARPFNHIGPRQSPGFAVADFAKKIAEIEKGIKPNVMTVGDTSSKRDFTDVRDVVRAYGVLMEKGEKGEAYNIGSGKSHSIQSILEMLLSFSTVSIRVETDKKLLRPSDASDLVCDNAKIRQLGWEPHIPLERSLKDTLDYYRSIV